MALNTMDIIWCQYC